MITSTDDFIGLPHVVILSESNRHQVQHFSGPDAQEKAHLCAQDFALAYPDGTVFVAVRYRTIFRPLPRTGGGG